MARAHRHFLPNHVWHITHRCHQKEFLLKFSKDRKQWLYWLFEAKKRYGLVVLNYMVTSNHIHLLVQDTREGVIADSMQLMAGRSAQRSNQRKKRKGAYWEDRYHATAIENDAHLFQCMTYIDLNMVRAGVVNHPKDWSHSGYNEIQKPPQRYSIINFDVLIALGNFKNRLALQTAHKQWVDTALAQQQTEKQDYWSNSVAVGNQLYVENIQQQLGVRVNGRHCEVEGERFVLREPDSPYNAHLLPEKGVLSEE